MSNKEKAKQLFDLLTETFGSKEVAAGILGNIDVETGGSFDADQKQYNGGPGRGLFQMEGQMLNAYNNYIGKNNKENNINTQVEFLKDILTSGENYDIGAGHRKKIQKAFESGDVDLISEEFSNRVLRPGKPNLERRKKSANTFFDELSKAFAGSNAYAAEITGENTMAQTAQDPRESLTLLQRLLTSPQIDAMFSGMDSVGNFMRNPSEGAGTLARGGADALTKTIQENPQQSMDLFKKLMSMPNPAIGMMISGAEQASKFAKGFMKDSGQSQASEIKSPYQEGVNKALKSLGEQQAVEAVQSGVPVQQVEQQAQQMFSNNLSSALAGQPQQAQQQFQPQPKGQEDEFNLIKPNILQKLFDMLPEGRSRQINRAMKEQELRGELPLQERDRERIGLETDRAIKLQSMNNLFSGKISDREKQLQTQQSFESDLESLVSAWDGLGIAKGSLGGTLGGLSAATIGQVFGTGREARAKFESISNGVLYSAGAYILGQTGRALVESDLKRLEKMAKFTPSMKAEDFKGKIQAILDFANSKVSASGGKIKYKTADELMNSVKNTKRQAVPQTTPKVVSFQIAE